MKSTLRRGLTASEIAGLKMVWATKCQLDMGGILHAPGNQWITRQNGLQLLPHSSRVKDLWLLRRRNAVVPLGIFVPFILTQGVTSRMKILEASTDPS